MPENNLQLQDQSYRIDNSGIVYPIIRTLRSQSLFRIVYTLKEDINHEYLLAALEETIKRYPSFRVRIRQGFFRYYFDYNELPLVIHKDIKTTLAPINYTKNNQYLFLVNYHHKTIGLEFWHCLCDGHGAFEFTKTLLYYYISISEQKTIHPGNIKTNDSVASDEEHEDAFKKYYSPVKLNKKSIKSMLTEPSYRLKGKRFRHLGCGIIQGSVNSDKLKETANKYGATITAYLTALLMVSIVKAHISQPKGENIVIFIPVNLRKIFPSQTLRNFVMFVNCSIKAGSVPTDVASYIPLVKEEMTKHINKESLTPRVAFTSMLDKNLFFKYMPQALKTFLIRHLRWMAKSTQTMILSNLGVLSLSEDLDKYIENVSFILNTNHKTTKNLGIITHNKKTVFTFSRKIIRTDIEKEFFRALANEGLEVSICTNERDYW